MDVAVVVMIARVAAAMFVSLAVIASMTVAMTFITILIMPASVIVIAVMFVVAVAVSLGYSNRSGERQRYHRDGASPEPELQRHFNPPINDR
jgi:hypothetical protein